MSFHVEHPVRKCRRRSCRKEHTNIDPFCSYECATLTAMESLKRNRLKRTAVARREKREYRARTMTISKLKAGAQKEFNRFIRERDFMLQCVSAAAHKSAFAVPLPLTGGEWDCGHYRTVGAAGHLRYDERNAAKQCKGCNGGTGYSFSSMKPTVDAAFRAELVNRNGIEAVEAVENDNTTRKWTRDELVEIRRTYLAKWKALKAAREARQ